MAAVAARRPARSRRRRRGLEAAAAALLAASVTEVASTGRPGEVPDDACDGMGLTRECDACGRSWCALVRRGVCPRLAVLEPSSPLVHTACLRAVFRSMGGGECATLIAKLQWMDMLRREAEREDLRLKGLTLMFGRPPPEDGPFLRGRVVVDDGGAFGERATPLGALRYSFACVPPPAPGAAMTGLAAALLPCNTSRRRACIAGYRYASFASRDCRAPSTVALLVDVDSVRRALGTSVPELEVVIGFVTRVGQPNQACRIDDFEAYPPENVVRFWTVSAAVSQKLVRFSGEPESCSGIAQVWVGERLQRGDADCWARGYTSEVCCTAEAAAGGPWPCDATGLTWERCCGPRPQPPPPRPVTGEGRVPCLHPYCFHSCIGPPPSWYDRPWEGPVPATLECGDYSVHALWPLALPENVVDCVPEKDNDLAFVVAGDRSTYIFEGTTFGFQEYFRMLRGSLFVHATKKNGWDSRRLVEALSSGTVPLYLGLDLVPQKVLSGYPRELLREALHMPGLERGRVRPGFDMDRYVEIASELLRFAKHRMTSTAFVDHMLNITGTSRGPVLCIRGGAPLHSYTYPVLVELRRRFGEDLAEYPAFPHTWLYDGDRPFGEEDRSHRYPNMRSIRRSRAQRSREDVVALLGARAFSLVVIPEYRWGGFDLEVLDLALKKYQGNNLVFIDDCDTGWGDKPDFMAAAARKGTLFMRELPDECVGI